MVTSSLEFTPDTEAPKSTAGYPPCRTQVCAARILNAWIAGDRVSLDYELSRWHKRELITEGGQGREELLLSLVHQMMAEPDLFAPRSAKLHLGVWIDLLAHLAAA